MPAGAPMLRSAHTAIVEMSIVFSKRRAPRSANLFDTLYLIGHLDGRYASLDEVPRARDVLLGSSYEPFVNRLREVLRGFWSRRGQ